jgi:large subunit ribosomal protein L35
MRARARFRPVEEMTQMPKMKTKSGAKKRFKITGTGKVLSAHAGKRHGMIKRTNKQIRHHRGTRVMFKTDGEVVKKNWLPNG